MRDPDQNHVGTYSIDGTQVRLCFNHADERRAQGQDVQVPLFDEIACIAGWANRPELLRNRPCVDCGSGDG